MIWWARFLLALQPRRHGYDQFFEFSRIHPEVDRAMDKKTKKRLEVLRQKLEKSQKLLAAAKLQPDEPDEVEKIEKQIADLKSEISEIKNSQ